MQKKPSANFIFYQLAHHLWINLGSVSFAVFLLTLCAISILLGAWCPQESTAGQQKIVEQFGPELAFALSKAGITDLFHTPFFLTLICLITINMTAASFTRVFPKAKNYLRPPVYLHAESIRKMPRAVTFFVRAEKKNCQMVAAQRLRKLGFFVTSYDDGLVAESGRFSKFAATITHIGLLTLLSGIIITALTGYSGYKTVTQGESFSISDSKHSPIWLGSIPNWTVKVDDTRRVDYDSGAPKQWFSTLSVRNREGELLEHKEISVNEPLSCGGVDIYQSSWALTHLTVILGAEKHRLPLQKMGERYAAFIQLDKDTTLILSAKSNTSPLRLFAKRLEWDGPRKVAEMQPGSSITLGQVPLTYLGAEPVTGLQYKADPGLPFVYTAFGLITLGITLAAIPHSIVWMSVEQNSQTELLIAGKSNKAYNAFENLFQSLVTELKAGLQSEIETTQTVRT